MVMKKIFYFMIFVITNFVTLQSQDYIDSSQYEIPRILETYKLYQNQYENKAWNLLISFITEDEILKNKFKKLKIFIVPILKFSIEAQNFKSGENIFKYLVFDTINFESNSVFYYGDSLLFFIWPCLNDCTVESLSPGGQIPLPVGENIFYQNIYKNFGSNCTACSLDYQNDSLFQFEVEKLSGVLKIIDNSVCYRKWLGHGKSTWIKNQANQMLNEMYSEEWVRYCATMCPPGGLKEKIIINKPHPYKKK
jgi:hypothetical protein